jgi:aerobic carbon-monoxide dehydrogenase large subunit
LGTNAFGQPMRRREDTRLLTGRGRYTADLLPEGCVFAAILRSPPAHADLLSVDVAAACMAPGVLAVLTGEDLAADGIGDIPTGRGFNSLKNTPNGGNVLFAATHPALARGKIRYGGDAVAMVVAESEAAARDALELIVVDYQLLPAVTDTVRAAEPGAPLVWQEAPGNRCFRWEAGDAASVERAFGAADRIVRLSVVNNRVHVGALETRGAIGAYDAASGRYTLTTGGQMPHLLQQELADEVLRVSRDRVRVLVPEVGGSFGIKNALYPEQALVLWAARRLGRSVAWIGDRGDGFLSDYQARDNVSTGELALDAEGRFLALRVTTLAAVGAYLAPKGQNTPTLNTPALAGVYRLPAIHVTVEGVFSNTPPTEAYRGAGRPEAVFLLERLVDHAARELGHDRLALRRRNLLTPAELPYQTALGLRYDSGDFPAMLEAALEQADLAGFPARRAASERGKKLRGFGFAHYCERVAGGWSEHASLELDPGGRVTVLIGTMSNGQGHETAYAQLVADLLGLAPDEIDVVQGDTDRIPEGNGTGGSASLSIGGAALQEAAGDLIRQAKPLAAEALEAAEADIALADGAFTIVGTDRAITWRALAGKIGRVLSAAGFWQPQTPTFPNGCHVAEVEIDRETGAWSLARYTMLHDFGRVLNPLLLEGQLQGGVAQGFGQAACERVAFDPDSGQLLSGSLMDYQLPRADDFPALVLETRATPAPSNPLGVKGSGEAGCAGAPPAVMNALLDALAPLGVRTLEMPATSEQVWRAMRFIPGR